MFRVLKSKRVVIPLGVVVSLAIAGGAFAYFTSTGSATGSATVGSSSAWTVSVGVSTGTMYPGTGSSTFSYTVTNPSSGHQYLAGTTATVVDDGSGNITSSGTAVSGCLSKWFTATNTGPAAQDVVGGGTATGSVNVVMSNDPSSQNACQGKTPDIKVSVS